MLAEPFNQPQYVSFETDANSISNDNSSERDDLANFNVCYFSGISIGRKGFINGKFKDSNDLSLDISDIRYSYGEWIAIAGSAQEDKKRYIIFGDDYGYCPIFYTLVPGNILIISDTFQGVISALEASNLKQELNIVNYVTAISSQLSHFQNSFSQYTMAKEIKILMPGQYLFVSDSSISVSEWDRLDSSKTYESSLRDAVGLACSALEVVNELPNLTRRLTLSGGVDSRVALSLLKHAGVEKSYGVFSMDPRTWTNSATKEVIQHDVVIADSIRQSCEMGWWSPGERSMLSVDFMESLAAYQSYRSNYSYTFKPGSTHTIQAKTLVTVRGGGGEMLRSTEGGLAMSKKFESEHGQHSVSINEEAEWIAELYTKNTLILEEFKGVTKSLIIDSYLNSKGTSFEERMNSFYFNYRNRAHFGHIRHASSVNDLNIHILSNPYFLEASRKSSFEERKLGSLVKDIFSATASELLSFPFESILWTGRLAKNPVDIDLDSDTWMRSYDHDSQARPPATFLDGWSRGERGENFTFDPEQSSINFVIKGFDIIESRVPASVRADLKRQHEVVLKALRQKKLNPFGISAKVASALDVFTPYSASGHEVRLSCKASHGTRMANQILSPMKPRIIADGISNIPVFEQRPEISFGEGLITVRANPQGWTGPRMDFAFYLLKDGKRVDQRWYEESELAVFTAKFGNGTYSAISFARPRGLEGPTYRMSVGTIQVSS